MRFFGFVLILVLSTLRPLPALSAELKNASASRGETVSKVFRFHIPSEPTSLDPKLVQSSDASYFLNNVSRGLYVYSQSKGLQPAGAKSCRFETKLRLTCELNPRVKWSDGSTVVADDYVRGFRRLIAPDSRSWAVESLKALENAVAIHSGKTKAPEAEKTLTTEALGVTAIGKFKLRFDLEIPDPDILYKLTSSVFVPVKSDVFPSREESHLAVLNGPYLVEKWLPGRRVQLKPNPYFEAGDKDRPRVEALFIDDDQTALHLYEEGELTFLRRLPTTEIPKSKARPDFIQIPMARFDYIGFGTELRDQQKMREALSYALDFKELAKIYDALGIPGCPSLPRNLMADEPCVTFDLARAKAALEQVPSEIKGKRLKLAFSKLGGDDIKKGAEWMQAQWKKHLGLTVDLQPTEQGVYLSMIRQSPPPIFRKGVGLDRPTCLAALETFAANGPENFLHYESAAYESLLRRLAESKAVGDKQKLCSEGIKLLLNEQRLIPLGRIHFTLLARPEFAGWTLNEMNQLDLSRLHVVR